MTTKAAGARMPDPRDVPRDSACSVVAHDIGCDLGASVPKPSVKSRFPSGLGRGAMVLSLSSVAGLVAVLLIATPVAARDEIPLMVEILQAKSAMSRFDFELTGTLEAEQSFPLAFRSSGRVLAVAVQVGERVSAGQVLAQIDPLQARAAARAAAAQLAAAGAGVTQADLALERARYLLERGAGTRAELDSAQEASLATIATRDQAQAALEKAQQTVEDTSLVAAVAGIVTARTAEPGQIVSAGQTVLTIATDGAREAVVYAPNVPELEGFVGRKLQVIPMDAPDLHLVAQITEVSPLADVQTGTVRVRAKLESVPKTLLLGAPVSARIRLPLEPAIALPWSALAQDQGQPAVWTVAPEGGRVKLRPVRIYRYSTDGFEVDQGLELGDAVVGSGSHLLFPNREVRPAPKPPQPDAATATPPVSAEAP